MSKIKMIAVDMDGTFLNRKMEYDRPRFWKLFEIMKKRDIKFVVASGNQYYQLISFFEHRDDEMMFVAENGSYISDGGIPLKVTEFSENAKQSILAFVGDKPDLINVFCTEKRAYMLTNPERKTFVGQWYHRLEEVKSFNSVSDPMIKFNINCKDEDTMHYVDLIKQSLPNEVDVVTSGHGSIDLIVRDCHKAFGLKLLADKHGITADEIIVFGDGGNDVEMLRMAKYSYAMENAPQYVKESAKFLAPSNEEQGVLTILEQLLHQGDSYE
ncbi:MAG: Cof-type HAD-IIB family hydrolase [Erysipelotrichaceae bacterium]|nr:Cof-type HAD-IIB family hydrolase [Erysipelotrichaceae bacterium]